VNLDVEVLRRDEPREARCREAVIAPAAQRGNVWLRQSQGGRGVRLRQSVYDGAQFATERLLQFFVDSHAPIWRRHRRDTASIHFG
jgi:hypothetical protein